MFDFLLQSDALSAIFAFALVLIPAVIIHELGHFLAAKAVGITVLEFGIGFPPRMVTLFRRGATEYTLNWLPIGGFVRPLGEDFVKPVSAEVIEQDKQALKERLADEDPLYSERATLRARGVERMQSVNETRPLGRILFMSAGAIANLITGFILFVIIALSGLPTVIGGSLGIAYADPDSPLGRAGLQPGDLIETINGEYFESSERFFEQYSALAGQETTLSVQRGGDVLEVQVTPEALTSDNMAYVYISSVAADSPASAAGMQPEDLIVAFNGEPFSTFDDLPTRTQARVGQEVTLTLFRAGETFDVTVTPRENPPANQGAIGIGIMPAYRSGDLYYVEGAPQQSLIALPLGDAVRY
ncbi:MAG: site-2 protease family protein, partial [Anaerolineae bacterium]|nr:site-2 protease family protein [Anaerolineae bacterium]